MSDRPETADEALPLLRERFLQLLEAITRRRLQLESEYASAEPPATPPPATREPTLTSRRPQAALEAPVRPDDLEVDRVAEWSRKECYERMETLRRRRLELERREQLLVRSALQLEVYLRAVFFLRDDASRLQADLLARLGDWRTLREMDSAMRRMRGELRERRRCASKAIGALKQARLAMFKAMGGPERCRGEIRGLIEQYFALRELQNDLQRHQEADEGTPAGAAAPPPVPAVRTSALLASLRSELREALNEASALNEQIGGAIAARARDEAAWVDIRKWIQDKVRCAQEYGGARMGITVSMADFVAGARVVLQRLESVAR